MDVILVLIIKQPTMLCKDICSCKKTNKLQLISAYCKISGITLKSYRDKSVDTMSLGSHSYLIFNWFVLNSVHVSTGVHANTAWGVRECKDDMCERDLFTVCNLMDNDVSTWGLSSRSSSLTQFNAH